MTHHTQLDDKLGGADNFRAWKYNISPILEENDLDKYISGEVPSPEGDEAKAIHKKNLVKSKRTIGNSIKDHLILHVSSLKTPKEVFDALMKLFEGKNINQKMTYDIKEHAQECENTKFKDHAILLHEGFSNQGTTRSS